MKHFCKICNDEILDRHGLAKICFPCDRGDYGAGRSRAHAAIQKAIKTGQLLHPKNFFCIDCGAPAKCYDHRDYNKPLEVDPVCRKCNFHRGLAIPLDMSKALPKKKQIRQKLRKTEFLFTNLL